MTLFTQGKIFYTKVNFNFRNICNACTPIESNAVLPDYLLLETPQQVIDAYFIKISILLHSLFEASCDHYFI